MSHTFRVNTQEKELAYPDLESAIFAQKMATTTSDNLIVEKPTITLKCDTYHDVTLDNWDLAHPEYNLRIPFLIEKDFSFISLLPGGGLHIRTSDDWNTPLCHPTVPYVRFRSDEYMPIYSEHNPVSPSDKAKNMTCDYPYIRGCIASIETKHRSHKTTISFKFLNKVEKRPELFIEGCLKRSFPLLGVTSVFEKSLLLVKKDRYGMARECWLTRSPSEFIEYIRTYDLSVFLIVDGTIHEITDMKIKMKIL